MNKILAIVFVLLLSACTTDFYETGDSPLSYLRTDFVEIRTAAPTIFTKAITDDSDTLLLDPSIKANWAQTADSTYRALLYYRKTALRTVTPLAINYIPVVRPTMKTGLARFADPVTLQSAWISKNRKYLNLGIALKTGAKANEKQKHILGIAIDTTIHHSGNISTHKLRFFHNRNGIPAHYTSRIYLSLPLGNYHSGDTIILNIPTSVGPLVRSFPIL